MIASGHANRKMRDLLGEIGASVSAGNPLSDSLRKYPDYFDDLYCD
jgi:type IV pilus assembly protein PilC